MPGDPLKLLACLTSAAQTGVGPSAHARVSTLIVTTAVRPGANARLRNFTQGPVTAPVHVPVAADPSGVTDAAVAASPVGTPRLTEPTCWVPLSFPMIAVIVTA